MAKLFIPTDRIGLVSFQNSISNTFTVLNHLLAANVPLEWHLNGLRLPACSRWPEGHYYQCGFAAEDTKFVRDLLEDGGIRYDVVADLPQAAHLPQHADILLYDGRGAGREFSDPLAEVLDMGGFSYAYVTDDEIRAGRLMECDIFLVPGSPDAGECYYAGLGDRGYDQIRNFVAERGNYLGICGGAYLPLTSYHQSTNPYWLGMVEATDMADLDYWRSGSGFVRCRIDAAQHPLFAGMALGKSSSLNLVYWEGPAIEIIGDHVRQLAHFESLIASGGGPLKPYWDLQDNEMAREAIQSWYNPLSQEEFDRLLLDKTAFAEADYNGHHILMFSPHPEMGNIGYGVRKDSLNFLLIYNGLTYLSEQ